MLLTKKEVRLEAKRRVSLIKDRAVRSEKMTVNVLQLLSDLKKEQKIEQPLRVGLFLSMPTEINTAPLIQALQNSDEYLVLVPRAEEDCTMHFFVYSKSAPHKISKYGIWEPTDPVAKSMVPNVMLVPGLAFDLYGGRVGHGKGYYDYYFDKYRDQIAYKIALAYDSQIFDRVPMDTYDKYMDGIATDERKLIFV